MEGVKLRWAIPLLRPGTDPKTLQSRVMLYGISLLTDPTPSLCNGGWVILRCTHSPLQPLRARRDLSVPPEIRAGWGRGVQTDGCQQGITNEHVGKKEGVISTAILWNLCWKFSRKTSCPHAPLSSAASSGSISSV